MKKKTWLIVAMGLSFAPGALADVPRPGQLALSETPAESHKCLLSEIKSADFGAPVSGQRGAPVQAKGNTAINGG